MRKLFLFSVSCLLALSAWAQSEVNGVQFEQGSRTEWFLLADQPEVTFNDGVISVGYTTFDLNDGEIETTFGMAPDEMWYTVRTDGANGKWSSICLDKNVTAIDGARFWNVIAQNDTKFALTEVTAPEAGVGYLIYFTAAELKVKFGDQTASTPVAASASHPIQGVYTEIDFENNSTLIGNYVVEYNELHPVTTTGVGLLANQAYVIPSLVSTSYPAEEENFIIKSSTIATELENANGSQIQQVVKYIRDGQLYIVKDGKTYNALGILLSK